MIRAALAGVLVALALTVSPVSASVAPSVTTYGQSAAECAAERRLAHEPATARCVVTVSTSAGGGGPRPEVWLPGQSWITITGPFNLWGVKALAAYVDNGQAVWLLYEDCTSHAVFGVGIDISSCATANNGGAYVGYMSPGVTWRVSLTVFSRTDVARWRVYTNGYWCCATATAG